MSDAVRVWVAHLDARVLTYHDWDRDQSLSFKTYCGLPIWDRVTGTMGVYLRTDHAEKIGKPCHRCFEVTA